ncbi:Nonribosomal peptide synthetase 1-like protein 1 [Colletotrichum chlorophyti]|uniref:Nonribosomal peptide synthetase 1-like protein 1 n=1 Tax=Colletotrichum chlorophyti TaxID=708187 RepID=A0A1Q8S7T2_9PEZI|nr:Nonribosomal peptide synthetase 1-like protein 1 [Colletotrichum chlorophyti]
MTLYLESTSKNESLDGTMQPPRPFEMLGGRKNVENTIAKAAQACCVPQDSIEDIYPPTHLQEGFMIKVAQNPKAYLVTHIRKLQDSVDIRHFDARQWLVPPSNKAAENNVVVVRLRSYNKRPHSTQILCRSEGTISRTSQQLSPRARDACSFDTLLVIQPQREEGEKDAEWQRLVSDYTSFAIVLNCHLLADGVQDQLMYDPRIAHPLQAKRMIHQLEHILHQLCNTEDPILEDLGFVSPYDKEDPEKWSCQAGFEDACMHQLVNQQTVNHPLSPAVC